MENKLSTLKWESGLRSGFETTRTKIKTDTNDEDYSETKKSRRNIRIESKTKMN